MVLRSDLNPGLPDGKCNKCSREETIQRRQLLIIRKFLLPKLFKGEKYLREETIRGNTVYSFWPIKKVMYKRTWTDASRGLSHKHLLIKATTALYLPTTGCSAALWYCNRSWTTHCPGQLFLKKIWKSSKIILFEIPFIKICTSSRVSSDKTYSYILICITVVK